MPDAKQVKKLALVINNMNPYGGLQLDALSLCRTLLSRGYRLDVFTRKWELETIDGITPVVPDLRSKQTHSVNTALSKLLSQHHTENNYLCKIGFTRVAGLDFYFAGDACLKHKLKQQGRYYLRWLPRYRQLLKLEAAVCQPEAGPHIWTLTPKAKLEIQQQYATPDSRFSMLPPQLNSQRLQVPPLTGQEKKAFLKRYKLQPSRLTFLHVSSAFRVKGVDRILRSLAALPKDDRPLWQLMVVGDDRNQRDYENLAKKLGIEQQVQFVGPQKNIAPFYQVSDLLLHPARKEQAGATVLEAIHFGLGVITCDNVGFAHRVSEAQAGRVLPSPFEHKQMTDAIAEYLKNETLRTNWRQNALKYAAENDLFGMADKAADEIDSFIAQKYKL
jgi:UDP-glucose:(heptosyl)LPS alpha-1,3-glucosyltransferase